jgi:myosin I
VDDFASTLQAMTTIGLSQQEIDDIFKVLAAILWLGNVQFVENNEGNASIADDSVPTYVAYLMDVDGTSVNKVAQLDSHSHSRLLLLASSKHREVDVEDLSMKSP